MLRQSAFTGSRPLLKGALHCHTTRSDGKGTPEEVIRLHRSNGYDFMALTDHRIYNYENYAPDTGMVILPGMEMDRNIEGGFKGVHCFHTVVLGLPEEDNPYRQDQRFAPGTVRDQFEYQAVLDELHSARQLTMYCHPEWSNTPAREFDRLRGNFAMEIWNSGGALDNDLDTNAAYWDELLMQGQRIWGAATDDGHGMEQHCLGWVRVNSENRVDDILRALREGAFYASCGPEIEDFYVENGRAYVRCSDAVEIQLRQLCVPYPSAYAGEGQPLRAADFRIRRGRGAMYVRAVVRDAQGRRAWTNPIFLEESDFTEPEGKLPPG